MAPLQGLPDRPILSIFRGDEAPAAGRSLGQGQPAGPIEGVLFDACGVIYDDTAWRRWLVRVLRQFNVATSYRCFSRVWERDFLVHVHRGQQTFDAAFRAFMIAIGLAAGQIDELEAASHAQRRVLELGIRPLPGVKSTLNRLQQTGLRLGVLANCEFAAAALTDRLERIGLGGLFATILTSLDLQQTKPEGTTYRAAAVALELEPGRIAFVGHDTDELAGAAAVGMPTVAFNFDPDAKADVFIARFEELLDKLGVRRTLAKAG